MPRNGRILATLGLLALSIGTAHSQSLRDGRVEIYPTTDQVGIVSRVYTDAAWIRMPQRVKTAAPVEFLFFSDGGDVVARGVVSFVTPTAPYEAYVINIRPAKTSHPLSPFREKLSIGAAYGRKGSVGTAPYSDPQAVGLMTGNYARVTKDEGAVEEGAEPVRAHIAALRARNSKFAASIANAAARALKADPLRDEINDEPVDFSALYDYLRPFRRVVIEDRATEKLLGRLFTLVVDRGYVSERVSTDFLRPADDVNSQNNGNLSSGRLR